MIIKLYAEDKLCKINETYKIKVFLDILTRILDIEADNCNR